MEEWLQSPRGPIRRERVLPEEAIARWQEHRARFGDTGLWPLILTGESLGPLEQGFRDQGRSVEDAIEMGMNLDPQEFFSGILAEYAEEDELEEEERLDLDFDAALLQRNPLIASADEMGAITQDGEDLWLVLLPCGEPWEVPAVLGYGGWNACPTPAAHVAVLHAWYARHVAEPFALGFDTLHLLVRPIEDREEAKRAAIEQYAYCNDIVDQGVGTVRDLAECLLDASVWSFWWD